MALDAFVGTLDGIAEELHGYYNKTEHGYKLAVNGVIPEKDVLGLKHALNEIKEERDNLKKAIKPYKEAGILDRPVDDVLSTFADYEKLKSIDPAKEADKLAQEKAAAIQREWQAKYNVDVKRVEGERDQYAGQVRELMVKNAIRDAAIETKANAKLIDPIIRQFIGVKEDGSVYVKNPQTGGPDYAPDGSEMTVAQKMHQMRESADYMVLFEGTGNSGSGGTKYAPPGRTASGKVRIDPNDTTAVAAHMKDILAGNVEWVGN